MVLRNAGSSNSSSNCSEVQRRGPDEVEVVALRIQVEHHLIGYLHLIDAAEKDVRSHAGLIDDIHQVGGVITHEVGERCHPPLAPSPA